MFKRVDKVLVGKDINRTASLASFPHAGTTNTIQNGEILVLDKNMKVLVAGATIADTDTIFIAQGTGETETYVNKAGTTVSFLRFILSTPIEGALVKSFKGVSYDAKSEQVTTFTLTNITPITAGTQVVLRIVYKDINEHPGQFTQTYRYTCVTGDTVDTVGAALMAVVNAYKGRRVTASVNAGSDYFILTGRVIPQCTTSLVDIDKFSQVRFDAFLNYVTSAGVWASIAATQATVVADYGAGTWEQVRDLEKAARGYVGIDNKIHFPVIAPDLYTVKDATYDLLVIESDKSYQSPDNQYTKKQLLTTVVAIPVPSSGTQMTDVLAVLNPWFASCPGAFPNVSV